MHSPLQARYPELSAKFDVDQAQAAVTRRNFLERYCDTDTLCCTAHFPSPSTGRIRRAGNGFSCEAVAEVWLSSVECSFRLRYVTSPGGRGREHLASG